jgi:carboxylesterase
MIIRGAEPFYFPGNTRGVLLVHGFSGSPGEVRELGEKLHIEENYTVKGILLPGHGTNPHDLEHITWQDWYKAVENGVLELMNVCSDITVVGMSMGALLTLLVGTNPEANLAINRIVTISAPVYLYDWRVHFLWLANRLNWALYKRKRKIAAPERYNVAYNCMPLKGVKETWDLINYCKTVVLPRVKVPCLILQSKTEHTVRPISAEYIYKHIGSKEKRIVWFHCKHVMTLYEQRAKVYAEIKKFIKEK